MAKSKRNRRAKNNIVRASQGALIKADNNSAPAIVIQRKSAAQTTLFSAEFEEVIEIIAKDRVYRAMLARLGRRLLTGPKTEPEERSA